MMCSRRRTCLFAVASLVVAVSTAMAQTAPSPTVAEVRAIYELTYLRPGLPAPAVKGKARNGGTIDLAALRGRAVVLVFWGST